ncbi:MAG TPA: BamA/TamA family outer membrane protein [Gemmatimonadales bacterium]
MRRTLENVLLLAVLAVGSLAAQGHPDSLYVGTVHFKGNKALDGDLLAAAIATSSSGWLFRSFLHIGDRSPFDEVEFKRDVVRLQLLYRQQGFYEAKIDTTVDRRDRLIDPTFIISEGPPIIVDSVSVTGVDSIKGFANLVGSLPLQKGKRFDRVAFEESGDSVSIAVRDRGYPYAIVFRNFTVDRVTRIATVQYDVLTGPHARIGDIKISGNVRVHEATVRRELTIRPGDEYRLTSLLNTQRSLYQSELFRYARVGISTPDSTVDNQDSLVRVGVQVAEDIPTRLKAGVGYGTIDCLRASGTLTRLNFLGEARRLDIVTRLSKIGAASPLDFGLQQSLCSELRHDQFSDQLNYLASVTLSQPTTLLRGAIVSVQGFAERRSEFDVYRITSIGGQLSLKYGFGSHGLPVTLSYRLSRDQTTAEPAVFCAYFNQCDATTIGLFREARRQGALTLSIVNQRVDSPIEPTRGRTLTVELTSASPLFLSQVVFDRAVIEGVVYRPVGHRRILSARLRGGIIRQGLSNIGGVDIRYVPPSERFYAGGPTTVRGYARNEMGPQVYVFDSTTSTGQLAGLRSSPIGSSGIVLSNVEMRFPTPLFGGRIAFSAFVDGGELWDFTGTTYRAGGYKITPGIGFQIDTPLGPMRLTSAYNGYTTEPGPLFLVQNGQLVDQPAGYPGKPRSSTFIGRLQWHFSVGLAF